MTLAMLRPHYTCFILLINMFLVSFMLVAQKIIFRDVFTSISIHQILVVIHWGYFNIILIHLQANQSQLTLHLQNPQVWLIFTLWPKIGRDKKREKFLVPNLQSLISAELKLKSKFQSDQNDPLFFLYMIIWLIKAGIKVSWLHHLSFDSVSRKHV